MYRFEPKTEYKVLKMNGFNEFAIITNRIGMMSIKDAFKQVLENEKMTTREKKTVEKLVADIKEKISN